MPPDLTDIQKTIKAYILEEFLPGEDPEELTPSTPLISGGILDSIATLKLVSFLEEHFHVEMQPHEVDGDYLGTLEKIARLVQSKL